jgi:glycosyltransferase involved in cell wall biosynthesis
MLPNSTSRGRASQLCCGAGRKARFKAAHAGSARRLQRLPRAEGSSQQGADGGTERIKICVNTQTPLIQFMGPRQKEWTTKDSGAVDLSTLTEDVDYRYSPGGVTRMVFPLMRMMQSEGFAGDVHWVSLNRYGPETVRAGGITLRHVSLAKERMAGYGKTKETIWGAVHGTGVEKDADAVEDAFWSPDYSEYAYYNRLTAEVIADLDKEHDFDIFYIHDFQQLPIGHMLGTLKPKLYRWHVPFEKSMIPAPWKPLLSGFFNDYDLVIVSTTRYMASLKSFGFTGRARKVYPYVDPTDYTNPPKEEIEALCRRLKIGRGDQVVLVVARLDPMKGQDRALGAVASIAGEFPKLKLVIVGNGSFSSSGEGLGLTKGGRFKQELESLAKRLRIESRVVFAGHLPQRELDAMYERCEFTILPSLREGFGLVVIESWLHRRACLVTERAGASELIERSRNSPLFDPDDVEAMGKKMARLLTDSSARSRTANEGFAKSRQCTLEVSAREESKAITDLVGG